MASAPAASDGPAGVPERGAPPVTPALRAAYGVGQIAEGLKAQAFSLFLLFFYTQVAGLSGSLAGQAILIALLVDAVTDPLVGVLSDRLHSRWGRRHPFLYASALPLAVSFYLTFTPPVGLSPLALFSWLAGFTVLSRFFITFFYVPHLALGAELSDDYDERTRIVTSAQFFRRIGYGLAGGLGLLVFMRPTAEFPHGQLNPAAYPPYALTVAVSIALVILLSGLATHSRIPYLRAPDAIASGTGVLHSLIRDTREALAHRSFRALFFGTTLTFTAWGVTTSLSLHLGTYFWRVTTDQMVIWGVCEGAGVLVALPYWSRVAETREKKTVFLRGLGIYVLFLAGPTVLKLVGLWPASESALYVPAFVVTTGAIAHFGLAATMVTGGSMMADVTDLDELRNGRRREGIFFGAASFAGKASLGLGGLLAGLIIDAVGLVPGIRPEEAGPDVVRALGLALALSTGGLIGLSIRVFSRYDLSRARHAGVRAELELRDGAERRA